MSQSEVFTNNEVNKNSFSGNSSGKVGWECPSNIALIKYWGKADGQIPMNPSLSFTLKNAVTQTTVSYEFDETLSNCQVQYTFEEKENIVFGERVCSYIESITNHMPYLKNCKLRINSENTFPHSSGIASSASAFGALALCLVEMETQILNIRYSDDEFLRKASFIARLGSGSACRSVYGGYMVWGATDDDDIFSNEYALPISESIHPIFKSFCDTILLIDKNSKKLSSSAGHNLMDDNPFSAIRFRQAGENLKKLLATLSNGDLEQFIAICEYEALTLHAMMMTSYPGYMLLSPASLQAIELIRDFRKATQVPVCFTIDAGANMHVLYPHNYKEQVNMELITPQLKSLCIDGSYINDSVGDGPMKLKR